MSKNDSKKNLIAENSLLKSQLKHLENEIAVSDLQNSTTAIEYLNALRDLSGKNKQLEREISAHEKTAIQLEKSEAHYRSLVETTTDIIYMIDKDGKFTFLNKAISQLGYNSKELIGTHFKLIVAKDDYKNVNYKDMFKVYTGKKIGKKNAPKLFDEKRTGDRSTRHLEIKLISKKGEFTDVSINYIKVLVNSTGVYSSGNELLGSMGIIRDITEHRRTEDAILYAKQFWEGTFDAVPDLIMVIDQEHRIVRVNQAMARRLDLKPQECIGRTCYELIHETSSPPEYCLAKKLVAEGKVNSVEIALESLGGEFILSHSLLEDQGNRKKFTVLVARDITGRKRVEQQIKASLQEKEVLLKEIHHRVKNNLQIISSLLNLQAHYIRDPQAIKMIRDSQRRVGVMALIHEHLYHSQDLVRIVGADYIRKVVNNVFLAYEDLVTGITPTVRVEDISLSIEESIPCGLIISELVSNSMKHAFPQGRDGEIRVVLRAEQGGRFTLEVSDNGVGLPADLDFRGSASLGLHLVNILVRQIGGTVEIDRSAGTKFVFNFKGKYSQGTKR